MASTPPIAAVANTQGNVSITKGRDGYTIVKVVEYGHETNQIAALRLSLADARKLVAGLLSAIGEHTS